MRIKGYRFGSIALVLVLHASTACVAQGEIEAIPDYMELADQYARCAAYFQIAADAGMGNLVTNELLYGAWMYSVILSIPGRDREAAIEASDFLIAQHEKRMLEVLNGRSDNVAILIDRYHQDCVDLVVRPPQIVTDLAQELESTE